MKKKYLMFAIQFLVILISMIYGFTLWDKLPVNIPLHFDDQGNPEAFAPKLAVILVLTGIFLLIQIIVLLSIRFSTEKPLSKGLDATVYWLVPALSILISMLFYTALLKKPLPLVDSIFTIAGAVLLCLGCFFPDFNKSKNEKWIKPFAITGYVTMFSGILMMIFCMFGLRIVSIVITFVPFFTALIVFLMAAFRKEDEKDKIVV